MLTDTHCHLDDQAYQNDLDLVLENASNLGFILNPGCDLISSEKAVELANKNTKIYAAVGIHPENSGTYNSKDLIKLKELAENKKVLAIGEIGLDYYYEDNPAKKIQKRVFRDQIELAQELKLPYIIHDRQAHDDILEIINNFPGHKCVVHAFSGSLPMAKEIIEKGNYISVGGVLTFKNADNLRKVIKEIPLENILIETDGPYLTPVPFRGKRNEPAFTHYVVNALARLKNLPVEEVLNQTENNARKFFNVDF